MSLDRDYLEADHLYREARRLGGNNGAGFEVTGGSVLSLTGWLLIAAGMVVAATAVFLAVN
jgi:hypothetical protein